VRAEGARPAGEDEEEYQPPENPSGCARAEPYRRIPGAEKDLYLPARLTKRRAAVVVPRPLSAGSRPANQGRAQRILNRRVWPSSSCPPSSLLRADAGCV
jgi:hypothetical protein